MRASFIQIGEEYFATIIVGANEDVLKDAAGEKLPFASATRAVAHARREIAKLYADNDAPASAAARPHAAIERWHADKVARLHVEREAVDLIGVEVVRIRKRKIARP